MLESRTPCFTIEERDLAEQHGLMTLQGCTRHVLLGHKKDIHNVAQQIETPNTLYKDAGAYQHLLCYLTGQYSRAHGEGQIVSQFKRSWDAFSKTNPEKAKSLSYLYSSILADNALIRSTVTPELRPAFYESIAHALAEHLPWEPELIVVGAHSKKPGPSEITVNIARQLTPNHSKEPKEVLVTHPDPKLLSAIVSRMRREPSLQSLKLTTLPFDDAFDTTGGMRGTRVVYSALNMGEYPEADRLMAKACGEQEALGGRLIHLGGASKADRCTRGIWTDQNFEYAIMPEQILRAQQQARERNAELLKVGAIAAENCAKSRLRGLNPLRNIISKPPEEYAHISGLDRGGRSRTL